MLSVEFTTGKGVGQSRLDATGRHDGTATERRRDGHGTEERADDAADAQRDHLLIGVRLATVG